MSDKKQIGKILLRQRALSPEQLDRALADQKGGRLASRLAAEGTISDIAALKALSEQHGIPGIDLNQICLRLDDLDLLPREIAEKHLILPVLTRDDRLFIAMANPREKKVIDELEFVTGKKVYPYVALDAALSHVIDEAYSRKARGDAYYVGPSCPPEMLAKLHLDSDGSVLEGGDGALDPAGTLDFEARAESTRPLDAPGVVVDDAASEISRSEDIEESSFGDTSRELSVVAELPVESVPPPPAPEGAKTILIVDDEADIRKMLSRLLGRKGLRVLEAERGHQALRLVKEHAPDLIVLDAMLPEVHGFEIARRIKGSERYGHIPIIMVSAVYRGWRYAEDLKQTCGVDHFIEKPFRIAEVVAAVEACLSPGDGTANRPDVSGEAEQALNAGVAAYKAGRLDEAIQHLTRGVRIDPLAYRLHFHLGLLYGKKGQVYDAISELETAVKINAQHFAAVKNLAILYQKAGFRNKAVETWERALTLAPDDPTRASIKEHLLNLL
ncbi:MAG TPA: response regulator [Polyangiaceae bacterium]|jgi:DNA-binding response OmpR family regulator|nr:response regulator [Polyangiaceae bacterium]